jgi:hypothetical protein
MANVLASALRLKARYTRDWFLLGNSELAFARTVSFALSELADDADDDNDEKQKTS